MTCVHYLKHKIEQVNCQVKHMSAMYSYTKTDDVGARNETYTPVVTCESRVSSRACTASYMNSREHVLQALCVEPLSPFRSCSVAVARV